jgi:hypothetical protein
MISFEYVMEVLNNNGVDQDYLEDMDNCVEGGTEEWMDIVSDVIGKSAYDNSTWTENDHERIMEFIRVMESNGIELL